MDKHRGRHRCRLRSTCSYNEHILQATGYQRNLRNAEQRFNTNNGIWEPYIRNNRNITIDMLQYSPGSLDRNSSANRWSWRLYLSMAELSEPTRRTPIS